ncbi:MAG: thermonuclease family protein [Gammaproteobacteria bacterium]|nr:thermonuclease family protein [Gammaproteobacteria bacterium]
MHISLYCYRAEVASVYDGDTCTVNIDLGLGIWKKSEKLRLNRINSPEMRGDDKEQGKLARDYLRSVISDREILLQTILDKKGKYGRYLAELWVMDSSGSWQNVNDMMIQSGHATYYENKVKAVAYDVNEVA